MQKIFWITDFKTALILSILGEEVTGFSEVSSLGTASLSHFVRQNKP